MLNITPISNSGAAKDYYGTEWSNSEDLGKYYYEDGFEKNQWNGKGAALLGLKGNVEKEDFFALCDNINPQTGSSITTKTKADRRVGWDFTFNSPKGVSMMAMAMKDADVVKAFDESVRETMLEIEKAAEVRVRKNGADHNRISGNLIWSEHRHVTARPVKGVTDPHLHTHIVVFNASYDGIEQKFKAADIANIKRDAAYYQAGFHTRLAKKLKDLGYKIERHSRGWDIAGIDKALREEFSGRTALIEKEAKEKSITGKAKAELGRKTREAKSQNKNLNELQHDWLKRLTPDQKRQLENVKDTPLEKEKVSARGALDFAIDHVFERKSVISEKRLFAEALKRAIGDILPEDLEKQRRSNLLKVKKDNQVLCTTKESLEQELEILKKVKEGLGICRPFAKKAIEASSTFLNEGQLGALNHVLQSQDQIMAIEGRAGVGKSTMMTEMKKALESQKVPIHAFAPTADASRGTLRDKGFKSADTVQKLLGDRKLHNEIVKRKGLILIDEAGLLSVKQMNDLLQLSNQLGVRVLLAGDSKQHSSVESGDAMRILLDGPLRSAKISKIMRQKTPKLREAVSHLSKGQVDQGFELLEELKAIKQVKNDLVYDKMAERFWGLQNAGSSTILIAPTHAEGNKLTEAVRDLARTHESITGEDKTKAILDNLNYTAAEKQDDNNYQPGQVVWFDKCVKGFDRGVPYEVKGSMFGKVYVTSPKSKAVKVLPLKNSERYSVFQSKRIDISKGDLIRLTRNGRFKDGGGRFNNGTVYKIEAINEDGSIKLNNSKTLEAGFSHFTYGYVSTSQAAQGRDANHALLLMNENVLPAVNQKQFYVSVSRGKKSAEIWTDDIETMKKHVRKTGDRESAVELLQGQHRALKVIQMYQNWQRHWKMRLSKVQSLNQRRTNLLFTQKRALVLKNQIVKGHGRGRTR